MEKYIENVPDSSQAKYYKIIHMSAHITTK